MGAALRIASICPSNTEVVAALGLADQLVGVDSYSDWPPEVVKGLPRLGSDLNIDMDRLAALAPDLVLASLSVPGMERNVAELQARGIPHLVLNPKSCDEILQSVARVGEAAGVPERAQAVVAELSARLEAAREWGVRVGYRPKLYWEWWPKPYIVPGQGNWLTEISVIAGAVNVFGHLGENQYRPSDREVVAADPDYILAVWTGVLAGRVPKEKILRRPGWERVTAVRRNQVYVLDEGLFCRPSPRLLDGLEQLVRLIHPAA